MNTTHGNVFNREGCEYWSIKLNKVIYKALLKAYLIQSFLTDVFAINLELSVLNIGFVISVIVEINSDGF